MLRSLFFWWQQRRLGVRFATSRAVSPWVRSLDAGEEAEALPLPPEQKGCTLIEMLWLICLLSLVGAGVGLAIWNYHVVGQRQVAHSQVCMLEKILAVYQLQAMHYPSNAEGLQSLVKNKFIKDKTMLKDPWGNAYVYQFPGTRNPKLPDIYSLGLGGRPGGTRHQRDIYCRDVRK